MLFSIKVYFISVVRFEGIRLHDFEGVLRDCLGLSSEMELGHITNILNNFTSLYFVGIVSKTLILTLVSALKISKGLYSVYYNLQLQIHSIYIK
jgi:hypothetical protein